MSTLENKSYGKEATPELRKCSVCGLLAADMVGDPPRCALARRCAAVKAGTALGSVPLLPSRVSDLRTAYDLDDKDKASVQEAVVNYQSKIADEKAEAAILANAIMDEAQKKD